MILTSPLLYRYTLMICAMGYNVMDCVQCHVDVFNALPCDDTCVTVAIG